MWTCSRCGETHEGLATVFGPQAPASWLAASDKERSAGELTPDQCVLTAGDTTHYFIRGHLEIPIVDRDGETFVWSVWCSLSEDSMRTTMEHWDDPDPAVDHPLVHEHRDGITWHRVAELNALLTGNRA